MQRIKIQCPAKINLTLRVVNKREDSFHNIESIMQTINLFDYLTISVKDSNNTNIVLSGTSKEIPYDDTNLVYKASKLFLTQTNIKNKKIEIFIDKNIPVAAGLAGGSTDAAGTLFGLNKMFNNILSVEDLNVLCADLGSDLNVCLKGGCLLAKGRGEIIEEQKFNDFCVNLIKPLDLGISAKEAYTKFSQKIADIDKFNSRNNYKNDLEWAVIDDYPQLKFIKDKYPTSIMTGSGSTYFSVSEKFDEHIEGYWVKNNLQSIGYGVTEV